MHAVTYVKCLHDGEFQENLFCCKELPPINKEQDLFNVVSSYLEAKVLEGLHCYLYRCAPSMVGSVQVLPSFGKKKKRYSDVVSRHYFLQRGTSIKNPRDEMKIILNDAAKNDLLY